MYAKYPESPGFFKKMAVDTALALTASLFKKLTVKQVLWGYDDDLLETIKTIGKLLPGVVPKVDSWVALQVCSFSDFCLLI